MIPFSKTQENEVTRTRLREDLFRGSRRPAFFTGAEWTTILDTFKKYIPFSKTLDQARGKLP
jgi:hypothetical protein